MNVKVEGLDRLLRKLAKLKDLANEVRSENEARLAEAVQPEERVSAVIDESKRPPRGICMEDAVARWSDPVAYAGMKEYEDAEQSRSTAAGNTPYELRHREFVKYHDEVERSFRQAMVEGRGVMSGITRYASGRRAVEPSLWDVLDLIFEFDEVNGDGRTYTKPEFFDPAEIPKNIDPVPDWLLKLHLRAVEKTGGLAGFQVKANYRLIICRGKTYRPGPVQATVLRLLHQAALSGDPLQDGKKLLAEAGAEGRRMQDVFKKASPVSELVESMGNGLYRLKL